MHEIKVYSALWFTFRRALRCERSKTHSSHFPLGSSVRFFAAVIFHMLMERESSAVVRDLDGKWSGVAAARQWNFSFSWRQITSVFSWILWITVNHVLSWTQIENVSSSWKLHAIKKRGYCCRYHMSFCTLYERRLQRPISAMDRKRKSIEHSEAIISPSLYLIPNWAFERVPSTRTLFRTSNKMWTTPTTVNSVWWSRSAGRTAEVGR